MNIERTIRIPRNLNENDIFKLGFGIKVKIADLPFIGIGAFVGYLLSKNLNLLSLFPVEYTSLSKGLITLTAIAISYFIVRFKIHGYELPILVGNRLIYTGRKGIYYNKRRSGKNEI